MNAQTTYGPRRLRGLTVIEVLIALVVMAVALAALAMTQVTTMRMNADSRRMSDATEYANELLEETVQAIVADLSSVLSTCSTPTSCGSTVSLRSPYVGTVRWGRAGGDYLNEGLVAVHVTLTEPTQISLSRTVSCIDVNPAPSVAAPNPCPFGTDS